MYLIGDLVFSTQGRDKGRNFMVMGIIDENYVFIADGSLRKLEKPKRKKIKHLKKLENLKIPEEMTNPKLRKLIKEYSKD